MRKKTAAMIAVGLGLSVLAGQSARAHHSFAMFDASKIYVWEGQVVDYKWASPHVHVTVRVPPGAKDPATVGTWDIEGAATNIMARQGWTKTSYKAGDKITVVGQPMRDGTKAGSVWFVVRDGKRMYRDVSRDGGPGANGQGVPKGMVLPGAP